ncbi:tetratricopeptide repeat protein [Agrobacterium rubi]|uniref:Tetratricopeptide repeat protein n=1 Tax=Agrobacterium rubi TaxID=28099 RepID=A0AAE7UMM3_9HYPH|nr:hypothetical protein [Agrobacterium rubi]NTE86330.1 hypothetical protein [Agrobacterium rubi]NTF02262.1 hypothetical protein [Agrobacterium rubi]NTF36506.1 hypothetical protein [Agrobacterium rubi]QTF98973.1 hypothetical protein G6M88_00450 [Agrobacterium rubi]
MRHRLLARLKSLLSSKTKADASLAKQAGGLHLPAGTDQLRIDSDDRLTGYIPLGFVPFAAHQLGNGDYFGLYWPVGRENCDPLIAETSHDDGLIEPRFSNLTSFLRKTDGIDREEWIEQPTFEDDPDSPLNCFLKARESIGQKAFDHALEQLEKAVRTLPEYTDALATLAGQYQRLGRNEDACRVAVQMIISPPSFGYSGTVTNIARWFSRLDTCPQDLTNDPIWKGRAHLASIPTGGTKDSPAYAVLREAIDTYEKRGDIVRALTLMQTYSDFMNSETQSFQERQNYDFAKHRAVQRELSWKLPDGPRFLL